MWGIQLIVMFVMVGLNGIFAAFEIALASISIAQLQTLVNSERRGAKAALKMKRGIEGSLAVVQLGITLVGVLAGASAGAGAQEQLVPKLQSWLGISFLLAEILSVVFVVIPLTAFMIIFGELIPKVFALRNAENVLTTFAPLMKWFSYLVWPLVWLLEGCVRILMKWLEMVWGGDESDEESEATALQELRSSVSIARASRLIGSQQEKIILGATELSEHSLRDIMLPTEFISMINLDSTAGDALVTAHLDMHTRFPVTESPGDPQGIIGYVMFKDIVAHMRFSPKESSIQNIVRRIDRYSADLPVTTLLERLIRERSHIALVTDEDEKIIGMVTMEDMLEELVGDIEDEYDRLPTQVVPTGRGWIVGGGISLESLHRQTGVRLPPAPEDPNALTINEWVSAQMSDPIIGSETIDTPVAKVLVRKTRRHKVMEAYLSPQKPLENNSN